MRRPPLTVRHVLVLALTALLTLGGFAFAGAQSQEPKPVLPATPVAESDLPTPAAPTTGVSGSSWQGPNWGVAISWDPAVWNVEGEFIDSGYDGLQVGTPLSTAYIEAYEGFGGDAAACLADAEREIAVREGVTEVVPLSDRPLPVPEDVRGEAQLFGLTLTLADGTVFRGVEYVDCRVVVPGVAVLELTWQTVTGAFNEDLPNVEALFAAIAVPDASPPAATPVAPLATPVA
ncbi:MAG: hypothetical protein ACRDJC_10730 [Thermomicrobiales bacterium]